MCGCVYMDGDGLVYMCVVCVRMCRCMWIGVYICVVRKYDVWSGACMCVGTCEVVCVASLRKKRMYLIFTDILPTIGILEIKTLICTRNV